VGSVVGVAVGLASGEGLASGDGLTSGVGLTLGDGLGEGLTSGVGLGEGLGSTVQAVMSVVHAPPASGQQYSDPPQDSTLPAALQILSSEVPSASGGVQLYKIPSGPGHCSLHVGGGGSVGSGSSVGYIC